MPRRSDSRPTIPVPAEPSIPEHAPDHARAAAWALDRMTGGNPRSWLGDLESEDEAT